jgi:hypothetical protein
VFVAVIVVPTASSRSCCPMGSAMASVLGDVFTNRVHARRLAAQAVYLLDVWGSKVKG